MFSSSLTVDKWMNKKRERQHLRLCFYFFNSFFFNSSSILWFFSNSNFTNFDTSSCLNQSNKKNFFILQKKKKLNNWTRWAPGCLDRMFKLIERCKRQAPCLGYLQGIKALICLASCLRRALGCALTTVGLTEDWGMKLSWLVILLQLFCH